VAELLVSVRSAAEAEAALAGGAALIDVKEPARGPLGRADDETIAAVIRVVAGRRLVTAALGELRDTPGSFAGPGLSYAKWGLAGCGANDAWWPRLAEAGAQLARIAPRCRPVAVAYADWQQAQAPPPEVVLAWLQATGWDTLLIDTWRKDGRTLLDWLTAAAVTRLCRTCRRAGVRVALAGALGPASIALLRTAEPGWFAVRSAACAGGRRENAVDAAKVRQLVRLLG
jgi:uncharacterized protein (UPF0264 family)